MGPYKLFYVLFWSKIWAQDTNVVGNFRTSYTQTEA